MSTQHRAAISDGSIPEDPAREQPWYPRDRARGAFAVVALVAAVLAVLPTHTAAADEPPAGPRIQVSATGDLEVGQVVTVTGSGFDPTGNLGTRPPFAGQPAGFYVVFGRFADPWRPSEGAPSSARQVIQQRWVLPAAQYQSLGGAANADLALLQPDGTFTVQLEASAADGTGSYAIATYPGSGAVNPTAEILVPVSFASTAPPTAPPTTAPPTTAPPTTAPPTTAPPTTAPPATGSGQRSAMGPNGQTLVVSPADDLDPGGAKVRVQGSGYDPARGVYVAFCVDRGPTLAPSPCVGGVGMDGTGSSSVWVSSSPPAEGVELAVPFGTGGTFDVHLDIVAADEFVDCLDGSTACAIVTRADFTASSDRSADVKVPVYFVGQSPTPPPASTATATTGTSSVTAGGDLGVSGSGFLAGEQVQIWLLSDPELLAVVTANGAGAVATTVTIPVTTPPGTHRIELRGLTSGTTVRSEPFTVTAASDPPPGRTGVPGTDPGGVVAVAGAGTGTGTTNGVVTPPAALAVTGSGGSPALAGALLVLAGAAALGARARIRPEGTTP